MNQSVRAFLCTVLLMGVSAISYAQAWPLPSKTPETPVACTGCPNASPGAMTVGYKAPIATFTGRYLDSSNTGEWFLPFRTARAKFVLIKPDLDRIYFRYGDGTIAAYQLSTFFSRLEAGEQLLYGAPSGREYRGSTPEVWLRWSEYFNPELSGSNWKTYNVDGSLRLTGFDVDDKGYVYVASTLYGWGVVKDGMTTSGGMMGSIVQKTDLHPATIAVVKGASRYYVVLGRQQMMDVTDRAKPVPVPGNTATGLRAFAKNGAGDRLALIDDNYSLTINSGDGYATGSAMMFTDSGYKSVTSDGTNFYGLKSIATGLGVAVIVPSGNGYTVQSTYPIEASFLPDNIHYGDGYIVANGADSGGSWDMRVIKVGANLAATALAINASPANSSYPSYFRNYYGNGPSGYLSPGYINTLDGTVYRAPSGKSYLIVCAKGIGDVYELAGGDSITTTNDGRMGRVNPNAPQASNAKTYYGDPVQFTARSASANVSTVLWNFGNLEAGPAKNTQQTTLNGQPILYQYSNLTKSSLGLKAVTASSISDANIRGGASVTLESPTARFGIAGTKYLFTQPNASSSAPIVVDDIFFDGSDGTIDGHYTVWTLDGVTKKTLPSDLMSAGQCGPHSLTFMDFYGPYSGSDVSLTTSGGNFVVGLDASNGAFAYSVRPFAAGVELVGSDDASITFRSTSRVTANATLAAQLTGFTYKWELVTSTGAQLAVGASGSALVIPNFVVSKASLNGVLSARVRLTLATTTPFQGACAGMETSVALSNPISAPDPKITQTGDCQAAPCTFTVASNSGIDMVADKWSYKWAVLGSPANMIDPSTILTGSTLSTTVLQKGTFTVQVTASNAVGTGTSNTITVVVNIASSPCAKLTNNSFVPTFTGSAGCNPYVSCVPGETINLQADAPGLGGYDPSCSPNHTYTWTLNGAQIATGNPASYAVVSGGAITLTVSNGSDSHAYSVTLLVSSGSGGGGTGGGGGGTGGGGGGTTNPCGTMAPTNVQPTWTAASCPNGGSSCGTNDVITFDVQAYLYSFACANHTFSWKFDDGSTANTQRTTHTFTANGSHAVTLSVSNQYQAAVTKTFYVTTVASTPGGGGGTGGGACPTMTTSNVAIAYSAASGCSSNNTSTACKNGETVNFDVTSYTNYDFNCSNTFTFNWNFGDGGTATGKSPSHTFGASGSHPVTVTVSNSTQQNFVRALAVQTGDGGGTGSGSCGTITPNVSLSINYANGQGTCGPLGGDCAAGEAVNFTVIAFGAYDLACATHTFDWDFGDNTAHASGKDVTHQYASQGTYTVKCNVSNGGQTATLKQNVSVKGGSPAAIQVAVSFVTAPLTGVTNGFLFTPKFDPPSVVTSWIWDFGDGQNSGRISGNGASPTPATHVYADSTNHTVTLTVYNAQGQMLGVANQKTESSRRRSVRH